MARARFPQRLADRAIVTEQLKRNQDAAPYSIGFLLVGVCQAGDRLAGSCLPLKASAGTRSGRPLRYESASSGHTACCWKPGPIRMFRQRFSCWLGFVNRACRSTSPASPSAAPGQHR
jgi:hypothetical protein